MIEVSIPFEKNVCIFVKNLLIFLKDVCGFQSPFRAKRMCKITFSGSLKEYIGHNNGDSSLSFP